MSNYRRIIVSLSCFAPTIMMEIPIPDNRDDKEYIDEFLEGILNDEFRYNAEWEFV